jgi:predicted HAD superfamily Cof-like phosphohydrolase
MPDLTISPVCRIVAWNKQRYEQKHCEALTYRLLDEEVNEFLLSGRAVDELDALVDIVYVAIGAMWKMGLNEQQIERAIHVVCDSNASKSVTKTDHTIKANMSKGPDFIEPEPRLQEILDERE